jgi:hypothetical protein
VFPGHPQTPNGSKILYKKIGDWSPLKWGGRSKKLLSSGPKLVIRQAGIRVLRTWNSIRVDEVVGGSLKRRAATGTEPARIIMMCFPGKAQPRHEDAGGGGGIFPNKEKDSFERKNRPLDQAGLSIIEPLSITFPLIT